MVWCMWKGKYIRRWNGRNRVIVTMVSSSFVTAVCIAVVAVFAGLGPSYGQQELVSDKCLACLCEMTTGCNASARVCEGDECGLFHITRPYWIDAGKPVLPGDNPDDAQAFARCTQDDYCSAQAVRGYMAKFAKDCNHDGKVACDDFAYIHIAGGYGCENRLPQAYYDKFYSCQRQLNL